MSKKRKVRTPEQIALTCKSAAEAQSKGIDVHRAYMQMLMNGMNDSEKKAVGIMLEQIAGLTDEDEQKAYMKKIVNLKNEEELKDFIKETG